MGQNCPGLRLAQLRVSRYFIKTMCPFSHCEDATYREQARLVEILGEIVEPVAQINSNLEERTLLEFVLEDHPLGILLQLFHARTN
jgi:hypothetical protein